MTDEFMEKLKGRADIGDAELIDKAEKDLALHKDALVDTIKERELQEKLNKIVMDNLKPLELTFEYQKVPEYWELQKEFTALAVKRKLIDYDMRIEQITKAIEAKENNIKDLKGEKND
jgi:hypothetical protein